MLKFRSLKSEPFGKGVFRTVKLNVELSHNDLLDYLGDKVVIDGEEFEVLGVDSGASKKIKKGEEIRIYTR